MEFLAGILDQLQGAGLPAHILVIAILRLRIKGRDLGRLVYIDIAFGAVFIFLLVDLHHDIGLLEVLRALLHSDLVIVQKVAVQVHIRGLHYVHFVP